MDYVLAYLLVGVAVCALLFIGALVLSVILVRCGIEQKKLEELEGRLHDEY